MKDVLHSSNYKLMKGIIGLFNYLDKDPVACAMTLDLLSNVVSISLSFYTEYLVLGLSLYMVNQAWVCWVPLQLKSLIVSLVSFIVHIDI